LLPVTICAAISVLTDARRPSRSTRESVLSPPAAEVHELAGLASAASDLAHVSAGAISEPPGIEVGLARLAQGLGLHMRIASDSASAMARIASPARALGDLLGDHVLLGVGAGLRMIWLAPRTGLALLAHEAIASRPRPWRSGAVGAICMLRGALLIVDLLLRGDLEAGWAMQTRCSS
jgi:hypothetical protein